MQQSVTTQAASGGARPRPWFKWLVHLDMFVWGGLAAIILVNRLLNAQLAVYQAGNSAAGWAILDFLDDMLPYEVGFLMGGLFLLLMSVSAWLWTTTRRRYVRYGVVLLVLLVVSVVGGAWLGRQATTVVIPPMTPTPIP
ncbi:MAG TPA: hypothetical protein PKH77_09185 [Anaerolineae bacterium]|nr:hypothetical protein [Anaerolineae bacterium]